MWYYWYYEKINKFINTCWQQVFIIVYFKYKEKGEVNWNKELDETEKEIALIKEKYKDRGLKGLEIVKEEQAISFAQDSINNLYD